MERVFRMREIHQRITVTDRRPSERLSDYPTGEKSYPGAETGDPTAMVRHSKG